MYHVKVTDQNCKTRNHTDWNNEKVNRVSGKLSFCKKGIHCYSASLKKSALFLASFFNKQHTDFCSPRFFHFVVDDSSDMLIGYDKTVVRAGHVENELFPETYSDTFKLDFVYRCIKRVCDVPCVWHKVLTNLRADNIKDAKRNYEHVDILGRNSTTDSVLYKFNECLNDFCILGYCNFNGLAYSLTQISYQETCSLCSGVLDYDINWKLNDYGVK